MYYMSSFRGITFYFNNIYYIIDQYIINHATSYDILCILHDNKITIIMNWNSYPILIMNEWCSIQQHANKYLLQNYLKCSTNDFLTKLRKRAKCRPDPFTGSQ